MLGAFPSTGWRVEMGTSVGALCSLCHLPWDTFPGLLSHQAQSLSCSGREPNATFNTSKASAATCVRLKPSVSPTVITASINVRDQALRKRLPHFLALPLPPSRKSNITTEDALEAPTIKVLTTEYFSTSDLCLIPYENLYELEPVPVRRGLGANL